MQEIQQKRIENELNMLKNLQIPIRLKKISKEEYYITVIIPKDLIEGFNDIGDVEFLIHFGPNFPMNAPKVYCKTAFCFPHICDGRDLLEDILDLSWTASLSLQDIISKIPQFLNHFLTQLNNGTLILIGNYYLGEKYDLSVLESMPVYIIKVKEKVMIDKKEKEFNKILMISDIYFCLFDQGSWSKNNLTLTFWSNIRSLVTIKKLIKGNSCRFFWKQKNRKSNYEMNLGLDESSKIIELMLEKMTKFGINYKLSKHNLGPKEGTIPAIDIETVEKNIIKIEQKVESNPDMEMMQYLMSLYDQAVEFYSATNNPRWEFYKEKIHTTLTSPSVNEFLDSERGKGKDTNAVCEDIETTNSSAGSKEKEGNVNKVSSKNDDNIHDDKSKEMISKGETLALEENKKNISIELPDEIITEIKQITTENISDAIVEKKEEKENKPNNEFKHILDDEITTIEEPLKININNEPTIEKVKIIPQQSDMIEKVEIIDEAVIVTHIQEEESDNTISQPTQIEDLKTENIQDKSANQTVGVKLEIANDDENDKPITNFTVDDDSEEEDADDN